MAASDLLALKPEGTGDSLQKIKRLRAPHAQCEWNVFAFVLNQDIVTRDHKDDLFGMVFPLGSFYGKEEAEAHAKDVILKTEYIGVMVARYAAAVPLTTKFDSKHVTDVVVDTQGRLVELESAVTKRENELYERQAQREREIAKEVEQEGDPDSLEHYKRKCLLAVKHLANFKRLQAEAYEARTNYERQVIQARDHYLKHPEHEKMFLSFLHKKLEERDELGLYKAVAFAYPEVRKGVLGISE